MLFKAVCNIIDFSGIILIVELLNLDIISSAQDRDTKLKGLQKALQTTISIQYDLRTN